MLKKIIEKLFFTPWAFWKPVWKLQLKTSPSSLPIAAFIISTVYISVVYALTSNFAEWRDYTIFESSTIIDENIPFIKNSIFIYGTYYLLFIAMALSVPLNKKGLIECIFAYQILIILSTLCFFIFVFMPIKVDTREGLELGGGLVLKLYEILYSADPPYNSWPSLHVSHSIFLCWILIRWIKRSEGLFRISIKISKNKIIMDYFLPLLIWCLSISISISTMTTKQHYFFDFVTGIIIATIAIIILKKCIKLTEVHLELFTNKLEN